MKFKRKKSKANKVAPRVLTQSELSEIQGGRATKKKATKRKTTRKVSPHFETEL